MRLCCALYLCKVEWIRSFSMPATERKRNAKLRVKYFPWIAIGSMRISISNNLSGRSRFHSVEEKRRRHHGASLYSVLRNHVLVAHTHTHADHKAKCFVLLFILLRSHDIFIAINLKPTPTTTKTKTMVTTTHYTHIHKIATRKEQLIKFQLKKAEFCAKNKNKKKLIWLTRNSFKSSPLCAHSAVNDRSCLSGAVCGSDLDHWPY